MMCDTDSYGCISWAPNLNTEDEEKQETIRKELMEMYGAPGVNGMTSTRKCKMHLP